MPLGLGFPLNVVFALVLFTLFFNLDSDGVIVVSQYRHMMVALCHDVVTLDYFNTASEQTTKKLSCASRVCT